jgi:hypothetical protein
MAVDPPGQAGKVAVLGAGMGSGYDLGYPGEVVERYDLTERGEVDQAEQTAEAQT